MNPAKSPSTETVAETIDVVSQWLNDVQAVFASGGVVDLAGLEHQVGQVCAAVEGMDKEDSRQLLPALEHLLGGLNQLWGVVEPTAPMPATSSNVVPLNRAAAAYQNLPDNGGKR